MDIKLNYLDSGGGEVLLLLHGNGESNAYFVHQIEYFQKKYRVIAVDTRGHGGSPRGTAPFTLSQFVEDLREFMEELSIPKAHILGFSDGGNIALMFAMKYPNMVDKLILNGANLDPSGVKSIIQIPIRIGYRAACMSAKKHPEATGNCELLSLMVNEPNIQPEELAGLRKRTLVIVGTNDMIKEKHSRLIYKSLPNAVLAIIPGNHFIANKKPKMFNEVVGRFLES